MQLIYIYHEEMILSTNVAQVIPELEGMRGPALRYIPRSLVSSAKPTTGVQVETTCRKVGRIRSWHMTTG